MKNTILLLTLVLLLASCAVEGNNSKNRNATEVDTLLMNDTLQLFDLETFDAQRRLWREQDLQNYSFGVRVSTYPKSFYSGTVIVKNGELDSFICDQTQPVGILFSLPADYDYSEWARPYVVPVSGIYDVIMGLRNWVENPVKEHNDPAYQYRYALEVEYNDEYHFPKHYSFSFSYWGKEPREGNGGGYEITITNFTVDP